MSSSTFSFDESAGKQAGALRKTLWPILLMVTVVVAVESLAYFFRASVESPRTFAPSDRLPYLEESIVQAKLDFIDRDKHKVELVILGDSSGLMGVDATALSQQMKCTTYNLCTVGWLGIEGHMILLEEFIAERGAPSVVVYHFAPAAMGRSGAEFERIGHLARLKWTLRLQESVCLLPSLHFRNIARRFISPDYDGIPRGRWPSHSETLRLLTDRQGSMSEVTRSDWNSVPEISGTLSAYQEESIRQLIGLSRRCRFRLYLIANPLPEIARTADNLAAMQALEDAIGRTIAGDRSIRLYRPLVRFYADESCATLDHLRPDAVHKNTATIAEWLLLGTSGQSG